MKTADLIQFHLLSFEGPDSYSRAGGVASRVCGLADGLAETGFETHLWFVGDPALPGLETRGALHLHRWCQWISALHPGGVYDGEEGKRRDYAASLPPFLWREVIEPHLRRPGGRAVVLAEEWHTAHVILHLDWLLRLAAVRQRVDLFWNANNDFGFDRIDWPRLSAAAQITTVSRYMRQQMWKLGIDPLVVPNGIPRDALRMPDRAASTTFHRRLRRRMVLGKVARWDPDKRWILAVETLAELKRRGWRPLLLARGGVEKHGEEVLSHAAELGLRVLDRDGAGTGVRGLLESLEGTEKADILNLRFPLDEGSRRLLFHEADAVLANSGREPFGLVGLETMGVGGVACTGGTGEDYAVPGWNSLLLQRNDPAEFVTLYADLRDRPTAVRALRRHARRTAGEYVWPDLISRLILPRVSTG